MAAKENKSLKRSHFEVLGICCSSEISVIENILNPLEGIQEVKVIVPTRTVIVVHDTLLISQAHIVKVLNQAGLEANERVYGEEKSHRKKWPSPYAAASGVMLMVSLLKFVNPNFRWVAVGAVAAGIWPILFKSFVAIRNLRIDINILALIAVIGTLAMKDFVEAATIVFLFTIAEWLESRAGHKANAVMSSLLSMAPQKAVLADTGEVVGAGEVKLGTLLAVKPGEVIAIDGIVSEGECEVDEKTLTGESFPVAKQKNSTVWAGTINLNGYVTVKTTALAEDCVVAKMAKLVEDAQNNKSNIQRFIDKCAKFYTPAVAVISTCIAVIPIALRLHNRNHWFQLALVVLVSACPCALILSTPVASFCALTKAATSGLLIKGGDYLEVLAKIKVMAFDKTGTITRGEFTVTEFQSLHQDGISLNTLLYWVSSIESKSSHPMATALVDHGRSLSIDPKPENVDDFQNFPGEGVHGKIDGNDIYIGNRRISTRANCTTVPDIKDDAKDGRTVGYIFCGATLAGVFRLSDSCRTGAKEAMEELKSLGIKTAMLTGDNSASALQAQKELGKALEIVHAELLPEDKTRLVNGFKKEGPTAMIGDGLNDAPALATADIGISMGISGSALAIETGDIILLSNDIRKIPKAIQLARRAHRKVIENVILSLTPRIAILGLAFAGHPLVWAAVLADVGTCVLVILNSMLLLRGTDHHKLKAGKSSGTDCAYKRQCCRVNSNFDHHDNHVLNHGCASDSIHSFNHHVPENCCSQKKTLESRFSDNCASKCCSGSTNSSSCGKTKSVDSVCKQEDSASSVKPHKHACCSEEKKQNSASIGVSKTPISSSCEKINCTDSTSNLDGSASGCCTWSRQPPQLDHILHIPECNVGDGHSFSPSRHIGSSQCSQEKSHQASFAEPKCQSKTCSSSLCGKTKCVDSTVMGDSSEGSLGCASNSIHSSNHHVPENCCSQKKTLEGRLSDNCVSKCCSSSTNSTSCRKTKSMYSACKQEDSASHEHGCCSQEKKQKCASMGASKTSISSSCEKINCTNSTSSLDGSAGGCCTLSRQPPEPDHIIQIPECNSGVSRSSPSRGISSGCCSSSSCGKTKCVNSTVRGDSSAGSLEFNDQKKCNLVKLDESDFDLEFQKKFSNHCTEDNCSSQVPKTDESAESDERNEGVHPDSKVSNANFCGALETAINIELGGEHLNLEPANSCKAMENRETNSCCTGCERECPEPKNENSCASLEKRKIGGCCKSYMKECCRKHGDIGTTVQCGLNEIVIE